MAPQRWKVSDWKNARLEAYRLVVKGAMIYRGGSEPITRDMQLGNLRDTYYEDAYGSLEPPTETDASKVAQLDGRRSREEATRRPVRYFPRRAKVASVPHHLSFASCPGPQPDREVLGAR